MPEPFAISAATGEPRRGLMGRLTRCMGVSVITTIISFTVIVVATTVFGVVAAIANVIATSIATVPSYSLNRRWTWGKRDRSDPWREVLPFWVLAFSGLALSTLTVGMADTWATNMHFAPPVHTAAVLAGNLGGFGVLWIVQFVLLDKVLFRAAPDAIVPATAARAHPDVDRSRSRCKVIRPWLACTAVTMLPAASASSFRYRFQNDAVIVYTAGASDPGGFSNGGECVEPRSVMNHLGGDELGVGVATVVVAGVRRGGFGVHGSVKSVRGDVVTVTTSTGAAARPVRVPRIRLRRRKPPGATRTGDWYNRSMTETSSEADGEMSDACPPFEPHRRSSGRTSCSICSCRCWPRSRVRSC